MSDIPIQSTQSFSLEAFLSQLHSQIFDVERVPVAIAAILMTVLIGMFKSPLNGNVMPAFWQVWEALFGNLGARMNKLDRLKGDLIFRGFLLTAMITSIAFVMGRFLSVLGTQTDYFFVKEFIVLCLCLGSGTAVFALAQLYKALNNKQVDNDAYYRIARSTRTDLTKSDDYTITRIGMGLMVKSFDKGIVAPIIWYLIFGLTGAVTYTALGFLSWRFGKEGHSTGFGQAANALERLMGFIPNMLSGVFIGLAAAFTPTAGAFSAFKGWISAKGRAGYEEGGFAMISAAWGLKVSLGGATKDIDGFAIKRGWVGESKATAQLDALHLHRVIYVTLIAHLLFIAALAGAMIFGETTIFARIYEVSGGFIAKILP